MTTVWKMLPTWVCPEFDQRKRRDEMKFYFYDVDEERLIGTVEAQNWDEALKLVRETFGYPDCATTLRLTPHEYWV